jgi:predicted RNA-binding protein with PUA-like domain
MVNYWLVKSEPGTWSIDDHKKKVIEHWDGVRNYQANNNMKKMKIGDIALMYHSVSDRQVVGLLEVVKEHYPDHTDKSGKFGMVDFKYVKHLTRPVHLDEIKRNAALQNTALIKQGRLSVMPLTDKEFNIFMEVSLTGNDDIGDD